MGIGIWPPLLSRVILAYPVKKLNEKLKKVLDNGGEF
jgi:hypothetical protein